MLVATADEENAFRSVVKFLKAGAKAEGAVVVEPTCLEIAVASMGGLVVASAHTIGPPIAPGCIWASIPLPRCPNSS